MSYIVGCFGGHIQIPIERSWFTGDFHPKQYYNPYFNSKRFPMIILSILLLVVLLFRYEIVPKV